MSQPEWTWKIFYEDGSAFSNLDGEAQKSPKFGLIAVAMAKVENEDDILSSEPYYLHRKDTDRWLECDEVGFWDQMIHRAHLIDCVRWGRRMWSTQEFRELRNKVVLEVRGK